MSFNKFRKDIREKFETLSKSEKTDSMNFEGRKFQIFPKVFSPKLFSESIWFGNKLKIISKDKKLLEVGTGTGIIALICALSGIKVETTDINEDAIINARLNFTNYSVNIPTYKGNVYSGIPKNKEYDIIFWNHPFNYSKTKEKNTFLKSIFDWEYRYLERYISRARDYLTLDGRLLLGTGNLADLNKIKRIGEKYGFKIKELTKERCYIKNDKFSLFCSILEFVKND